MFKRLHNVPAFCNATRWPIVLLRILTDEQMDVAERLAMIPYTIPPYGLRWLARRSWKFRHWYYLIVVDTPWRLYSERAGCMWEHNWPCYWDYWDDVVPGGMDSFTSEWEFEDCYWLRVVE